MRKITESDKSNPDSFYYQWKKKPSHRGYLPDLIREMEIGETRKVFSFRFYAKAHQAAKNVGAKISVKSLDGEDCFMITRIE